MQPRYGNEGGDHANKVIVHISRIAQSGGTGSHDRGDLYDMTYVPIL